MSKNKKYKSDFAEKISGQLNVEKQFVELVLDYFIKNVRDEIRAGESVYLSGFGTFKMHHKKATFKYDINTGTRIPIPAKNVVKFSVSKKITEFINTEKKK